MLFLECLYFLINPFVKSCLLNTYYLPATVLGLDNTTALVLNLFFFQCICVQAHTPKNSYHTAVSNSAEYYVLASSGFVTSLKAGR